MTKTVLSRRISSAIASRKASRTVIVTISVPSGRSGSAGVGAGAGAAGCAFAGAGARLTCGADCSALAGGSVTGVFCWSAAPPSVNAEASSPSPKIMAIGVLTATSLVPSGTKILPSVPSSTASTSMVALSVSISAMTSPDLIASPSFLCHLARLPFSIVGDSAGINTWIGMGGSASRLSVDVGVELGRIGLRVVGGELGGFVDDGAHLGVDLLQRVLGGEALLQQPAAHLLDRIVLGAHLVDFFLGTIFRRIRHGMAAIAIGEHFENDGPIAVAAPPDRPLAGRLDRAHVHAVDLLARDVERPPALGQVGGRRRARDRRSHPVLIVLDDVDHRELPQLRHVEALVDLALIDGAVPKIGQGYVVVAAVMVGEGEAGPERDLGGHDAMPAEETLLDREHVHRAALALGVAADQAHAVELPGLLLEASDEQHLAQRREFLLLAEFGHLRRVFRGRLARCSRLGRWSIAGDGHFSPRGWAGYRCGGRPPNSRNRRMAEAHGMATVSAPLGGAHRRSEGVPQSPAREAGKIRACGAGSARGDRHSRATPGRARRACRDRCSRA